ncbi:hypothetical protein SDC9_194326 [bioreactor metagenome]|uniref:Uncharacterized protein n=1 Tax=bioreactor metagenome TaxID=1076179 RepID=A0A645I652_9ZZZZ
MFFKIGKAFFKGRHVFARQFSLRNAAMHFKGAHRGYNNYSCWLDICKPAFNINKLLSAKVSAKTSLGDDYISQL